jgi:GTPase SAR1 family protein
MGNIAVIGPRSSGKTSYLAALAQWSVLGQGLYQQKFDVQAIGEDAEKLSEKAEAII